MNFFVLAWRNIWRNRRRTLITIASVFFAVSLATFMRSLLEGVYGNMIRNVAAFSTGYVQVHQKGYWNEKIIDNVMQTSAGQLQTIRSIPGVIAVLPRIETFALASSDTRSAGIMLLGIDPELENPVTDIKSRVRSGRCIQQKDKGVVIGAGLAKRLQLDVGDTIVLMTQGYHAASANYLGEVVGIASLGSPVLDRSMVYMPLTQCQSLLSLGQEVSGISIMISTGADLDVVKSELMQQVDTSNLEIMDWKEMMPDLDQMIEADSGGHKITMAVLYLVISFGVFSTVLMMMAERRHEFGIMIAIGMKKYQLAVIVVTETILLMVLGIAAGTAAVWPLIEYYSRHPFQLSGDLADVYESYGLEPVIPGSKAAVVFISQVKAVFLIGLLVSIYPIVSIARFRLMKAMRA